MPPVAKVIDYDIVKANAASRLQTEVKTYIAKGWVPLGAPFCDDTGEFYQALVILA